MATLLVTGGAGFIGSALIRMIVRDTAYDVVNVDKLTYAGSLEAVADVSGSDRYHFERVDVCDAQAVRKLFDLHQPAGVIHLAAETHVDRSIDGPPVFVQTNVVGTFTLLQEALHYWRALRGRAQRDFRFVQVSTDEVFGSLGPDGRFHEGTPYAPRSPYAASKASADHLARAWFYTYGLPVMTTNCSNNYGPFQYPEKLMPLMIQKAVAGAQLPVYGSGENIRDWLFVDDHARALLLVLERGTPGETYNVGADNERTNLDVVRSICDLVNELAPDDVIGDRHRLITFVADRPGHDERYAIDASRIRSELGWMPRESFASGLRTTVEWYLANQCWCERVQSGRYAGERLGVAEHAR